MKKETKKTLLTTLFLSFFLLGQQVFAQDKEIICEANVDPQNALNYAKQFAATSDREDLNLSSEDRIHVIDIAFLYAGSLPYKQDLVQNIRETVLKTNMIFICSGVHALFRVVTVRPDSDYNISLSGQDTNSALSLIRTVAEDVRSDYGADLVYGILDEHETDKTRGRATLRSAGDSKELAAKNSALGVVKRTFLKTKVLPHELGHNLGLSHSDTSRGTDVSSLHSLNHFIHEPPGPASGTKPFVPFVRGYDFRNKEDRGKNYGTIMTRLGVYARQFSTGPSSYSHGLSVGSGQVNATAALLFTIEDASNYSPTRIQNSPDEYKCNTLSNCLQRGRILIAQEYQSFVQEYDDLPTGFYYGARKNKNIVPGLARLEGVVINSAGKIDDVFIPFSHSNFTPSLHYTREEDNENPQLVDWVVPGFVGVEDVRGEEEHQSIENMVKSQGIRDNGAARGNIFTDTIRGIGSKIKGWFR